MNAQYGAAGAAEEEVDAGPPEAGRAPRGGEAVGGVDAAPDQLRGI
jgi:hypothetical protein